LLYIVEYTHFLTFSSVHLYLSFFFFFTDTPPTEIYTLSLHDALPISPANTISSSEANLTLLLSWGTSTGQGRLKQPSLAEVAITDRKSTRLNSSHLVISYAVFCLKKKKKKKKK